MAGGHVTERGGLGATMVATLGAIIGSVALLVVELVAAMLAYTYLALFHLELFGYFVRLSRDVLDVIAGSIDAWFPSAANQAYATLIGELGPKSILLLLIGLTVGAVIRLVVWMVMRIAGR